MHCAVNTVIKIFQKPVKNRKQATLTILNVARVAERCLAFQINVSIDLLTLVLLQSKLLIIKIVSKWNRYKSLKHFRYFNYVFNIEYVGMLYFDNWEFHAC